MVASRNRPKGWRKKPFGLFILMLSLVPTQSGYQDLQALLARQPAVANRARQPAIASPFGTIHVAMFNLPRPVGTDMPELPSFRLAAYDLNDPDITGSLPRDFGGLPETRPSVEFPTVNRALKGDMLVARPRQEPPVPGTRDLTPGRVKTVSFPKPADDPRVDEPAPSLPMIAPVPDAESEPEVSETPKSYSLASLPPASAPTDEPAADPLDDADPAIRAAHLYFGNNPVGKHIGPLEPWPTGEAPTLVASHPPESDIKRSVLAPLHDEAKVSLPAGQTIAPKGEVTGADKRPKTPAERLGLNTKERAKAEKCLANAVYFESRGEPLRGQIAVAQVVMNRVFSGFYPNNVCGVVYQNAHRRNACQFTFACDNVPDVVNEPDLWEQAKKIARETLDGKLWLTEIGYSTHYHAYWVHPSWRNEMRKLHSIGVHRFYRPRAWGDTVEVPNYTFVPPNSAKTM